MPFGPWPGGGGGGGGGVTSLKFNNGPALIGAIVIRSPMLDDVGASPVRIDNGNVKILTPAASVGGIDVDLNQSFFLATDQNTTIEKPTNSILAEPRDGEKITFTFATNQSITANTITFTGGNLGYLFATATSLQGVKLTDFNTLVAQLLNGEGVDALLKIGFEYDASLEQWLAVALAGFFGGT